MIKTYVIKSTQRTIWKTRTLIKTAWTGAARGERINTTEERKRKGEKERKS